MKYLFMITLLLTSFQVQAQLAEGMYQVQGWNPGVPTTAAANYKGQLAITKSGEAYDLAWTIGTSVYAGVGTYDASTSSLNVGYADIKNGWFGVATYKVTGNQLDGTWTQYKGNKLGKEIATKK